MARTTAKGRRASTIDLDEPFVPNNNSDASQTLDAADIQQAQRLIDQALALVGEDVFAELVESVSQERLRTAVGRLMSTSWWEGILQDAVNTPGGRFNTTLICKLLDKAVPTQQATKQGAEEGFKLLIETVTLPAPTGGPLNGA